MGSVARCHGLVLYIRGLAGRYSNARRSLCIVAVIDLAVP